MKKILIIIGVLVALGGLIFFLYRKFRTSSSTALSLSPSTVPYNFIGNKSANNYSSSFVPINATIKDNGSGVDIEKFKVPFTPIAPVSTPKISTVDTKPVSTPAPIAPKPPVVSKPPVATPFVPGTAPRPSGFSPGSNRAL